MRALQLNRPQHFEWIELPEAHPPKAGEALVAVRAVGICGTDISGYLGKMPFIEFPRILGHELGVEVIAVGEGITHLKTGDRCSVEPYLNCGQCHACDQGRTNCCESLAVLGVHCDGGMRERIILPAVKLHPCNELSFVQLALVETLAIGCHAVNRANLTAQDDVLIVGAGPIGLTVLEFARLYSRRITVLELAENRHTFVQTHYPDVQILETLSDEFQAQVVFDATGHSQSMANALKRARFTGRIVYVGITKEPVPIDDPLLHRRELTILASRNAISSDFPRILDLVQNGQINIHPWITHQAHWSSLPELMRQLTSVDATVVKAVVHLSEN